METPEAERIAAALKEAGVGGVALNYTKGYETSTAIRPRHYELWYGPRATTQ